MNQPPKQHGIRKETATLSMLSMMATMAVLEKIEKPAAKMLALAIIGALTAAGREMLYQNKKQGSWQERVGSVDQRHRSR